MSKSNAKLEAFIANGNAICDARIEKNNSSANYLKLKNNFNSVAHMLFAVNYDVNGLNGSVHGFNTKDYFIALALDGKRSYVHESTVCIFKTAYNLAKNGLDITQADIDCVVDHSYKIDTSKREREAHYVLTTNKCEAQRDTQKSQAKCSLEYFGVLTSNGKNTYKFNADSKAAKKLAEFLHCE